MAKAFLNRGNSIEPLCDMEDYLSIHRRTWGLFVSTFRRTQTGIPLSKVKVKENIGLFALKADIIIKGLLRMAETADWCIITAPKRRHKEEHFASEVCKVISKDIGITFYEDAVTCKNRDRFSPEFSLQKEITEKNIIIYDDIITTGITIQSMITLLKDKNILVIAGVNNKK